MNTTTPTGQPGRPPEPPRCDHYRGSRIAVGTRHFKQHQFAPPLRRFLAADLVTPPDLDTDRFGTFTGETAREGSPLDAARAKAQLAMTATGLALGLASEASYGPLPDAGWPGHEEILLFCDARSGLEIVEVSREVHLPGAAHTVSAQQPPPAALLAGLPDQALIVRPLRPPRANDRVTGITKGITDLESLSTAVEVAAAVSGDGLAVVEPDLRAHHNPSRRRVLEMLAARLAYRLATGCPSCGAPGFGRVGSTPGLPCLACGTPTGSVATELWACSACPHRVSIAVDAPGADPGSCPRCNP